MIHHCRKHPAHKKKVIKPSWTILKPESSYFAPTHQPLHTHEKRRGRLNPLSPLSKTHLPRTGSRPKLNRLGLSSPTRGKLGPTGDGARPKFGPVPKVHPAALTSEGMKYATSDNENVLLKTWSGKKLSDETWKSILSRCI